MKENQRRRRQRGLDKKRILSKRTDAPEDILSRWNEQWRKMQVRLRHLACRSPPREIVRRGVCSVQVNESRCVGKTPRDKCECGSLWRTMEWTRR